MTISVLNVAGIRSAYGIQVDALGNVAVKNTAAGVIANGTAVGEIQFSDIGIYILSPADANIARLYQAALGREPDAPGLSGWIDAFNTESASAQASDNFTALAGTPVEGLPDLAYGFTQSPEFQQKYGPLTDTQFITQLYQNVLGRAPDANGLNGWLSAMQNGDANGVHYTREMVLVGFAESPENIAKTAAAATSSNSGGWLVDMSTGGYADAGMGLNINTVLNQTNGTLNTALIDLSTVSGAVHVNGFTVQPSFTGGYAASMYQSGETLYLSDAIKYGATGASNTTIVGSPHGGNEITLSPGYNSSISGTTIELSATGNSIIINYGGQGAGIGTTPANSNTTVTGYVPGSDTLSLPAIDSLGVTGPGAPGSHVPVQILAPTTSAPVSGASLQFTQHAYVLNMGSVGAGDAASVAAVANTLYTVADVNGNASAPTSSGTAAAAGENLTIIGETSGGNAVIYQWARFGANPDGFVSPIPTADTNHNHQIDAAELTLLMTLVGVDANSLTAADFH